MRQQLSRRDHDHFVDVGVFQSRNIMSGTVCLAGHRLPMLMFKFMTRKEMREDWRLSDQEIDNAIRYWSVRGIRKVR